MKTGEAGLATATALQSRVPLFQPTDRPATTDGSAWHVTPWGRVRVAGRLGQRHADALQAMLHTALRQRDTDDGAREILVDPASVRRCMSDAGYSGTRLKRLLYELRTCAIELDAPALTGVPWVIGGLIDSAEPSPKTVPDPLTGGVRHLLRVRLGKPLVTLLDHDLLFSYDPAPIARLTHGISKAIVRHVRTHRDVPRGGWTLDGLIAVVGGPTDGQALRHRRHEIVADAPRMLACGVSVDGQRVTKACSTGPEACTTGPEACTTGPGRAAPARAF